MKFTVLLFSILCVVTVTLGSPSDHGIILRQRREVDFIGNTRLLVEQLVQNLRNAAKQAVEAVSTFSAGIQDQGKLFAEKIANDLQNFRDRVKEGIQNVTDRFTGIGSGVRACVESYRKQADELFTDTVSKSRGCANDRIKEIGGLVENLRELASNASEYASHAMSEMKNCTENGGGILSTGSCLGGVAVRTELKGAVFVTQSGFMITRINLALATLPASLEVCAGTRLVEAGIGSAKIIMEIGTCSASSVYSSVSGNSIE